MGIFSRANNVSDGPWEASVRKAPRWSAGAGTYRAHVNSDQLGDYRSRGAARRAAKAAAADRNGRDTGKKSFFSW